MADQFLEAVPLACSLCGRPLGDLPDDQPDWPSGPICGDCYQGQQQEDEIWSGEQDL